MAAATLEDILDNLNDFSDYEEVGSVSRAKSYITAAKRYLALPSSQSDQGSSLGYTQEMIRKELEHARAYVRANSSTTDGRNSSVRFFSVEDRFR